MLGYISQKGCHCCLHVFVKYDYDSINEYYCNNHDAGARPKCGSVGMDEDFNDDTFFNESIEWNLWANKREVNPWGICNQIKIFPDDKK